MDLFAKLKKKLFDKPFKGEDDFQGITNKELVLEGVLQIKWFNKNFKGQEFSEEDAKTVDNLKDALAFYKKFHEKEFVEEVLSNVYWEMFLRFVQKKLQVREQHIPSDEQSSEALDAIRFFARNKSNDAFNHRSKSVPVILTINAIREYKQTLIDNHFLGFFRTKYIEIFRVTLGWAKLHNTGMAL